MPYLIDGHNLIPKVPGLHLSDVDDEMQLIELLQEFCQHTRKQAEVVFDNAPPGGVRARTYGMVTARFVRQGRTADAEIQSRLARLGAEARNWTVVSSDNSVQGFARAARARHLSSAAFARLMADTLEPSRDKGSHDYDPNLSPDDLDEWLKLFGAGGEGEGS